jgi:hypothetical protein
VTSCFRIKALAAVLAVFGLLAIKPSPVFANANVLCETNVGIKGQLLDGYNGMVYSPVAFDQMKTVGSPLQYWNENKDGLGVLVFAGDMLGTSKVDAAGNAALAGNQALVTFTQGDGTVVHQCQVEVVTYDPAQHDLAKLQVGDCSMTQLAGMTQLVAGHAQVWVFPPDFEEISASPWRIADTSTLSASSFYLVAKTAGAVLITAIRRKFGEDRSISLCPFNVVTPQQAFGEQGLSDDEMCKDVKGAPVRLTVGQTAILPMSQGEEHPVSFTDFAISAPDVLASLGYEKTGNSWTITAIAPGTSSLTALTPDGLHAMGCEVVVE